MNLLKEERRKIWPTVMRELDFTINVYTFDIVNSVSRKFIYANGITLVARAKNFTTVENILNKDLINLQHYFTKWHFTLKISVR